MIANRRLLVYELAERWRWIRSALYVPKVIRTPMLMADRKPTKWWWFPRKLRDLALTATWRSHHWWDRLWVDLRLAYYDTLLWVGLWDLQEGGWYKDARWVWPWNARAPGWRVPTRTIYTWPIYDGARGA